MNDDANKTMMMDESGAATGAVSGGGERAQGGSPSPPDGIPAEISAEQYEALKAKASKAEEHWSQLLRVAADFDNYKKRTTRERQEAVRFANESLIEKLIPVLDNFEMALQAASDPKSGNVEALRTGVTMIYSQLRGVMSEAGLEEIEAADKPFDPNWHEAVSHQETASSPEGHVLQQLRKGYKLRDRLIRPASVIVAKKAAA